MNWFQRNFKKIIYVSFLIPIITVALVSISHVTKWYGISNPISWAVYLSIGIEIAAMSALAAITAHMGRKVFLPFGIVTLIQFIGNIFFSYQFIDVNSQSFKDWVDMVDPIVSFMGVESGNVIGHKRFLALFAGGMLPLISLSFLHMLVKFEEENKLKNKEKDDEPKNEEQPIIKDEPKDEPIVEEQTIIKDEPIVEDVPKDDLGGVEEPPINEDIPQDEPIIEDEPVEKHSNENVDYGENEKIWDETPVDIELKDKFEDDNPKPFIVNTTENKDKKTLVYTKNG
jgi:hypothetical protein